MKNNDIKTKIHLQSKNGDKVLLLLYYSNDEPSPVKKVIERALSIGFNEIRRMNVSGTLSSAKGLAIRLQGKGWELTDAGKEHVEKVFQISKASRVKHQTDDLRNKANQLADDRIKAFIMEAIDCLENGLWRAAVVLSWAGAVAVLYDHIVQNKLAEFNAEARRRDPKFKTASTADDLARIKEGEFLDILVSISILGKNVKEKLKNSCLDLRNACGHPNSFDLGEATVSSHLEILILNVFKRF